MTPEQMDAIIAGINSVGFARIRLLPDEVDDLEEAEYVVRVSDAPQWDDTDGKRWCTVRVGGF